MNFYQKLAASIILSLLVAAGFVSAREISDPHEILNRYFERLGGLERLKAEQASYSEGTFSMGGMEGSVRQWNREPARSRIEISLGPLNIIQGDNGEQAWVLDQNGKLQVISNLDEESIKRRRVRRLIREYTFAERASDIFTVSLEGVEPVDARTVTSSR
ncbi:MAG: hypothetical protein JSU69_11440 [Candidatus Zixiibacteriota bacterium]|nr:MAG: hypothetical protein JSU69_11440 [candidate division Zixibacteria bacterium]